LVKVANCRRKGDVEAAKAVLAEVWKLVGNSACGKFLEAVERQLRMMYTKDEALVDLKLQSTWLEDLEEVG